MNGALISCPRWHFSVLRCHTPFGHKSLEKSQHTDK